MDARISAELAHAHLDVIAALMLDRDTPETRSWFNGTGRASGGEYIDAHNGRIQYRTTRDGVVAEASWAEIVQEARRRRTPAVQERLRRLDVLHTLLARHMGRASTRALAQLDRDAYLDWSGEASRQQNRIYAVITARNTTTLAAWTAGEPPPEPQQLTIDDALAAL